MSEKQDLGEEPPCIKLCWEPPDFDLCWIPKDTLLLQKEVKLLLMKFPPLISILEILPDIHKYCSWRSWRRRQNWSPSQSFLVALPFHARWKTTRLQVSFIEHNVSWFFPFFFSNKYNLFVAFPQTFCGNKVLSFTL